MGCGFVIQLGHPKISQTVRPRFRRLSDVFLQLFREHEESAYLFWHAIPLRIRYREDLYRNVDDVLAMVWLVHRDQRGSTTGALHNQLVRMEWTLRWKRSKIDIELAATAREPLYARYADAINRSPHLHMPREAFLREWNSLLYQIVVSLRAGNVELDDGTERRKFEMLCRLVEDIGQVGRLYTRGSAGPAAGSTL